MRKLKDELDPTVDCGKGSMVEFYKFLALNAIYLSLTLYLSACGPAVEQTVPAGHSRPAKKQTLLPMLSLTPKPIEIPGGTSVTVRLRNTISSRTAKPGDDFDAELVSPLMVGGKCAFPANARVRGRVVAAEASDRWKVPGYVRLTLDSIQTHEGKWEGIHTSEVSAQATSHEERDLALIGGGGRRTPSGAIAAGGKGAAPGGAGMAAAHAAGQKDFSFPVETELTFRLMNQLAVSR